MNAMDYCNQNANAVSWYSLELDGERNLSPHFKVKEFACEDGSDYICIHPALVKLLESIRAKFKSPVIINSAYRTPKHNFKVGGSPSSRHILGFAADISVLDVPAADVAHYAREINAGGVGQYPDFTHVDVYGFGRRWYKT